MGLKSYLLDTYALFSIVEGKETYANYADVPVFLTIFNLVELYFLVLRDYGEKKAKQVYINFKGGLVNISDEIIFDALKLRLNNKKKKLSYADCVGYSCAKCNGFIFLTGDSQFENLSNVEFIK